MSSNGTGWRELERQLEEPSSFDRLLRREEEMESKILNPVLTRPYPFTKGNPQTRWLQRALNRISGFRAPEDGVLSGQTRKALQKFQAEHGLRPSGTMNPRTRDALIKLSGIPAPRRVGEGNGDDPLAEMEAASSRCPADDPHVIRGFAKFDDSIPQLSEDQQKKLAAIASEIARSQSGTHGTRVTQVIVVGHADLDLAIEKRNPGFLQYVSEKRAHAVFDDLQCKFVALMSSPSGVGFVAAGRGARDLAVPAPRTEFERKCNRRAEIILVRSDRQPKMSQPPSAAEHDLLVDLYNVALQGTSGQYEFPQIALHKAGEIAEKAFRFIKFKQQDRASKCPAHPDLQSFTPSFMDALQGTASKYSDTDRVIDQAAEIAEYSEFTLMQTLRRLDWKRAQLPQPMAPDCEIVRAKVPGPANHALCRTHDHILDTSARTVIAHDLDEYRKQFRR